MTILVHVYGMTGNKFADEPEVTCDVAECFPDDADSLALALADLRANGTHLVGGGAQPLFKLVRCKS